ncbi:NAD(P)H-binding protein [Solitalea lacus]|uniref:NAD(P)H-binding protein n=1 Tax=Solitalea lacus TaxID=2911172 RepID=UPI001EDB42B7|nr:NAD(P)H-binding protein [Solitalea lacus]UKJ07807.1 NAD(P)H-binding protein [Solitalea lacus]
MKTAIIIGASGLIGSDLLNLLLNNDKFNQITVIVRKPIPIHHPKIIQLVIDFTKISDYANELKGNCVFCCIGSTQKKAGTKEKYELIDRIYPREIGKIALQNGAKHFLLVSAMGANNNSRIFYNKLKGLTEQDINELGYEAVSIFRPSLLVGQREENRPGEKLGIWIMKWLNNVLIGKLAKYRSIKTKDVAKAMTTIALIKAKGTDIYQSNEIQKIADNSIS